MADVANVGSAYPHGTAADVVEAWNEARYRRLSTARSAHKGYSLALFYTERYAVKNVFICARIGEYHVVEGYIVSSRGLRTVAFLQRRVGCQLVKAAYSLAGLPQGLAYVHALHDALREHRRNEHEQYEVDNYVGQAFACPCHDDCYGHENVGKAVDDDRVEGHRPFPQACVACGGMAVLHYGAVEILEREHSLLEYLDYGYAADVLYRLGVHALE